MLQTAGEEAKSACGNKQLCAELEALALCSCNLGEGWTGDNSPAPNDPYVPCVNAIEHAMDQDESWDELERYDNLSDITAEGTSLFDAPNGFNKLHRYQMLWTVRYRWAKESRFAFNCNRRFAG